MEIQENEPQEQKLSSEQLHAVDDQQLGDIQGGGGGSLEWLSWSPKQLSPSWSTPHSEPPLVRSASLSDVSKLENDLYGSPSPSPKRRPMLVRSVSLDTGLDTKKVSVYTYNGK